MLLTEFMPRTFDLGSVDVLPIR